MIRDYPEIYLSNYNEDDVSNLNTWAIEAHDLIERLQEDVRLLTKARDHYQSLWNGADQLLSEKELRND